MLFSLFSVIKVNSILSLSKMNMTSIYTRNLTKKPLKNLIIFLIVFSLHIENIALGVTAFVHLYILTFFFHHL